VYHVRVNLTGTVLGGRYRVGPLLGRGGMGAVYEGVQQGIERVVALKVVHPHLADDPLIRARFQREARVVALVRHPNVVPINDYVESAGEPPFLVMERLRGETLREVMKRTPTLPVDRVVRIAMQMLSALDAAHRANVVHRDIKPDNVFLEHTTAQKDLVKLLDFGVAKLLGQEDEAIKLTRQGHAIGTPAFMAPEQAVGDPIDGRADLYGVGATIYQALTGRKPHAASNLADLMVELVSRTPAPVASLRPDVDAALSRVIDRALAKKPGDRFASARDMERALAPFANASAEPHAVNTLVSPQGPAHDTVPDPVVRTAPLPYKAPAAPVEPPPALQPPPRASQDPVRVAIWAAAVVVTLVIAGAGLAVGTLVASHDARTPPVPTETPTTTAAASPTPEPTWVAATAAPRLAPLQVAVDAGAAPTALPTHHVAVTAPTDVRYTPTTAVGDASTNAAPVCKMARGAKAQHVSSRVVHELERRCRAQGGEP
jgi:serine/threonine protein kinase